MDYKALSAQFSAIDTVLSLHYASSTTVPRIHDLCAKATRLCNRRIDATTFEHILGYDPDAFQIVHFGANSYDYGVCVPANTTPMQFSTLLPGRRKAFEARLVTPSSPVKLSSVAKRQISENPALTSPERNSRASLISMKDKSKSSASSPLKVTKNAFKNSHPRFSLKEKPPSKDGMSVLERIKLKEKQRKAISEEDQLAQSYSCYITDKLSAVYDILYELTAPFNNAPGSFKSFALPKVIAIIQGSITYSMSEQEVKDTILRLETFLPNKIQTLHKGSVCALKVFPLDRDHDRPLLMTN